MYLQLLKYLLFIDTQKKAIEKMNIRRLKILSKMTLRHWLISDFQALIFGYFWRWFSLFWILNMEKYIPLNRQKVYLNMGKKWT
jgi:hypothetical protein